MYTHLYTNTVKYIYIYMNTVYGPCMSCDAFSSKIVLKPPGNELENVDLWKSPCWHGVKYRRMWDLCARASRKRRGKMQSIECFELLVFQWDIFALTPSPSTHIRLASIFLALLQSELARGLLVNLWRMTVEILDHLHTCLLHIDLFLQVFAVSNSQTRKTVKKSFVWQDSVVDAVNRYWGRIDVKCRKSPTASYHEFHCGTNCRWTTGEHHPLAQGLCTAASEGTWHSCSPSMVRLDLRYLWCIFQHPRGSEMLVETVFRILSQKPPRFSTSKVLWKQRTRQLKFCWDLRYLRYLSNIFQNFQTPSFLQTFSVWHVHSGQNQGTQMVRIWVHTLKRHRLAAMLGTSRAQKRETWLRSFLKALQKGKTLKPLG